MNKLEDIEKLIMQMQPAWPTVYPPTTIVLLVYRNLEKECKGSVIVEGMDN